MPFVKLDCGILDSSLWVEPSDTRICWITLLAMASPTGFVEATAPGISRKACVSIEACRVALKVFESPDPDSRTQTEDGRRIHRQDGGFQIINYDKYREKDHTNAIRQARHRARHNAVTAVTLEPHGNDSNGVTSLPVTQAEAEAYTEAEVQTPLSEPKGGSDLVLTPPKETKASESQSITAEVWNYYIKTIGRHPKLTILTEKRKAMFRLRMKESWPALPDPKPTNAIEMCKYAIDKLSKSPHHNGQNQNNEKYLDWEIIFRTREQFEKWINR